MRHPSPRGTTEPYDAAAAGAGATQASVPAGQRNTRKRKTVQPFGMAAYCQNADFTQQKLRDFQNRFSIRYARHRGGFSSGLPERETSSPGL